jgi:hypothetical protein
MSITEIDQPTTALTVANSPLPVFRGREMAEALTAYRDLQKALDSSMPDQVMELDGKPFRKKGYWRAISVAFNLTVEPTEERREVHGVLDDGSENYSYIVTYRATAPNGRSVTGDGACAASEKQRGRMKASEHNVRSHAHTRSFNRAVSNLVGFGEVSAEEAEIDHEIPEGQSHRASAAQPREERQGERPKPAVVTRATPSGGVHIARVQEKTGTSKTGKPYTKFTVIDVTGNEYSTFDTKLADLARQCRDDQTPVELNYTAGKFGNDLHEIAILQGDE